MTRCTCTKPATWAGTLATNHVLHFCDDCAVHASGIVSWWPLNSDGSNKRVGDMTPAERRAVFVAARDRWIGQGELLKAAMANVVVEAS